MLNYFKEKTDVFECPYCIFLVLLLINYYYNYYLFITDFIIKQLQYRSVTYVQGHLALRFVIFLE